MKKAKGTHKSMGKVSGAQAGLESGVAETRKVDQPEAREVGDTGRRRAAERGSIAHK